MAILPIIPCGSCPGCATGEPFHCTNYQFLGSRNDGGFAEYCLVPEDNLFFLPEEVDLRIGAFIEPIAVAMHVLRRSAFQAGQSAIVFGAGSIGILIALWFKVFGASRVAITDIRPESLQTAREVGLDEVFYARSAPHLPMHSFDAAFEAAGSAKALLSAIESVHDRQGDVFQQSYTEDRLRVRASRGGDGLLIATTEISATTKNRGD